MNKVEQIYQDFWKEIVENPDGTIDLEQVKRELYDYYCILQEVPKVYSEVTGGAMSKPNYYAKDIIAQFNDYINDEFVYKDDIRDILDDQGTDFEDKVNCIKDLIKE